MKVSSELPDPQATFVQAEAPTGRATPSHVSTVQLPGKGPSNSAPVEAPMIGGRESNVTFRRDGNGRIYYVISDAQSGQEIQELPPQAIRSLADGIDAYLEQAQAKARSPLNTKG